jgi:hypothetical protein
MESLVVKPDNYRLHSAVLGFQPCGPKVYSRLVLNL